LCNKHVSHFRRPTSRQKLVYKEKAADPFLIRRSNLTCPNHDTKDPSKLSVSQCDNRPEFDRRD
jgi:hypothetical protein